MVNFGSFAGQVGKIFATRIVSLVTGIALSVVLARWLAPESYGVYLFTLAIAQFLALPVLAGLPALVTREIAMSRGTGDSGALNGIIHWSNRFVTVTSAALIGLAALLWLFLPGSLSLENTASFRPEFYAIPIVISLSILRLFSAQLLGFERPFMADIGDGLLRPVLILLLVLVFGGIGIVGSGVSLAIYVVATFAACLPIFWYLNKTRQSENPNTTDPVKPRFETRKWLTSLVPLSLVTGGAVINARLDVLVLGTLSESAQVAFYGISVQIAALIILGQTIVNSIVSPKIARFYKSGEADNLARTVTQAAWMSTAMAGVTFVAVLVFGQMVIETLVGTEFSQSWSIAIVLACAQLFSCTMGPVAKVLTMTGNEKTVARSVWISAGANLVGNLVLVPPFGALGAAVATGVCIVLLQALLLKKCVSDLNLNPSIFGRTAR